MQINFCYGLVTAMGLYLDPVYTVPDPQGHDIKLNSFKTSVALRFLIVSQNLIATNHRRSVKSKYGRKLTELNVVTKRIGKV